jgi:hypothetical protein
MNRIKVGMVMLVAIASAGSAHAAGLGAWSVQYTGANNSQLQVYYTTATGTSQYAALDTASSYIRFVNGPSSGWGTSVCLLPCYWSGGVLYQGAPVTVVVSKSAGKLVLDLNGTIGTLVVSERVAISPPSHHQIVADVSVQIVSGTAVLDDRPGEAFKYVFLSSMHESPTSWDSSAPTIGAETISFPAGQWIVAPDPVQTAATFGLLGGTSTWKKNAPTVEIEFLDPLQIAGWLNPDANPNDDNVGYWAATDVIPAMWSYTITTSKFVATAAGVSETNPVTATGE